MKILSAAEVDANLDDLALIDRLDALFRAGCEMPPRHHHTMAAPAGPGSADATLLLMPAWTRGAQSHVGMKVVTVFPDNGKRGCRRSTASICCSTAPPARPWRCSTAPC